MNRLNFEAIKSYLARHKEPITEAIGFVGLLITILTLLGALIVFGGDYA
ncbi:MAG: hypothetical protein LBQ80_01975 [Clostridium sp.]|jgi:hypothetical protein|nr:hypothetical protein [Clostridium sp.]